MNNYLKVIYSDKPYTNYPYHLSKYLTNKFKLKGKLLDLGCGRGEYLIAFNCQGLDVEGFDKEISDFSNLLKTCGDFNKKLPYKNNTFNIVFAKSIIEHTFQTEHIFEEVYRILKPKGKFIILTPDWKAHYKFFYDDPTHKSPFTLKKLERLYKIYNFKIITCEKFRQLPFLWGLKYFSLSDLNFKKLIKFWRERMLLGVGEK